MPVFLPEESHGQRSLAGYSPRGGKESSTTEYLSAHMDISYFLYPFISSWKFELFPFYGYYEERCYEHLCTYFIWIYILNVLRDIYYIGVELLDNMLSLFNILRNYRTQKWLYYFTISAVYEASKFSISLSMFFFFNLLYWFCFVFAKFKVYCGIKYIHFLYNNHHHPSPELSHLLKLKICTH